MVPTETQMNEQSITRRTALKGSVGATVAIMMERARNWMQKPESERNNTDLLLTAEEADSEITAAFEQLGFDKVDLGDSNKGTLFVPRDQEILDLLQNASDKDPVDSVSNIIDVYEQKYRHTVEEAVRKENPALEEEDVQSLIDDRIMDTVGFGIASYGMYNMFTKGGITKVDYALITGFSLFAYAVGNEKRRAALKHNAEETAVAVATIGTVTELSDFVILEKHGIVQRFLQDVGKDPGVNEEEMMQFVSELSLDQQAQLERILADYEQTSLEKLLQEMREEGNIDTAELIEEINLINGNLGRYSKVDKLRALVLLSNIGAPITTLVSTSILNPLCRSLAEVKDKDGIVTQNKKIMSTLQGYVPNNMGLLGIPVLYKGANSLLDKIPFQNNPLIGGLVAGVKSITIGGDFGPRLAIMQKAGKHGLDALEVLDHENLITQLMMNGGFALEMLGHIAEEQGKSFPRVLGEFLSPDKFKKSYEFMKTTYRVGTNMRDAFFGRFSRSSDLFYRAFTAHGDGIERTRENLRRHGEAVDSANQVADAYNNVNEKMGGEKKEAFESLGNFTRRVSGKVREVFNSLTDTHHWEHAIGEELVDIFKTLPYQSLCVPFIEGTVKTALTFATEKLIPEDFPTMAKNQIFDILSGVAFGAMSTSFDNFAANKAGIGVGLDNLSRQVEQGIISMEQVPQRITAIIKKLYDWTVVEGGGLPGGNMPNFKMFPLNLYTLADAIKNLPMRTIPAVVSHVVNTVKEVFGLYRGMSPGWFFRRDAASGH